MHKIFYPATMLRFSQRVCWTFVLVIAFGALIQHYASHFRKTAKVHGLIRDSQVVNAFSTIERVLHEKPIISLSSSDTTIRISLNDLMKFDNILSRLIAPQMRSIPINIVTFIPEDMHPSNPSQYILADHIVDMIYTKVVQKSASPLSTIVQSRRGIEFLAIKDAERYLSSNIATDPSHELTIALILVQPTDSTHMIDLTEDKICLNSVSLCNTQLEDADSPPGFSSCNCYLETPNNLIIVRETSARITNGIVLCCNLTHGAVSSTQTIVEKFLSRNLHPASFHDLLKSKDMIILDLLNVSVVSAIDKHINTALLHHRRWQYIANFYMGSLKVFNAMNWWKWLQMREPLQDAFIRIHEKCNEFQDKLLSAPYETIIFDNMELKMFSGYSSVNHVDLVELWSDAALLHASVAKYFHTRVPWQEYFIVLGPYWLPLVVPIVRSLVVAWDNLK